MLNLYPFIPGKLSIRECKNFIIGYNSNVKKWIKLNKNLEDLLLLCDGTNSIGNINFKISRNYKLPLVEIEQKAYYVLNSLKEEGIIKFRDKPSYNPIRFRRYNFDWPLQSVFIEVTNRCNLQCIHCYNSSSQNEKYQLKKESLLSFLDEIDTLGTFNVFFTGGEPFVREDFNEILNYTYDKGFEIGILTNGTLLDLEKLALLKKINPKFVAVSLDSLDGDKYKSIREIDNKKTIESILKLKDTGINVRINIVLFDKLNDSYEDIKNLLEFFKDHNFSEKDFAIDEFLGIGRGSSYQKYSILKKTKTIKDIRKAFKDIYGDIHLVKPAYTDEAKPTRSSFCGLGESICYLNTKGDITLCTVLNNEKFRAGNIFEQSFKEIWENSPLFTYFREKNHILSTKCETCSFISKCAGGCKAKSMLLSGTFNKPDHWACAFFKKI